MKNRSSVFTILIALIAVIGIFFTACKKEETEPLKASSIELLSGGNQTAQAELTLQNPVVIIVKDQNGDAFAGATVTFAVSEGSVSSATAKSNNEGKVSVNWTLGSTVGTQTLTVTAFKADNTIPLTSSPLSVTATATEESLVAKKLTLVSGNEQTTNVETALTNPVVVQVTDQNGDAFAGATVAFTVTEGTVSKPSVTTDTEGKATVNWTLGSTVGTQTLTATAFGADGTTPLTNSPLSITATGQEVLEAKSIELVSGNNQSADFLATLANPIVVIVKDQNGDALAGTEVSFTVTEGSVSDATIITNADGKASVN